MDPINSTLRIGVRQLFGYPYSSKSIEVWNNWSVSKLHNFHFVVNYPFNSLLFINYFSF